jgi:hypothetical protein
LSNAIKPENAINIAKAAGPDTKTDERAKPDDTDEVYNNDGQVTEKSEMGEADYLEVYHN